MDKKVLLEWYVDAGVDEVIDDAPVNYFRLLEEQRAQQTITTSITHPNIAGQPKAAAPVADRLVAPAANSPPLHHSPSAAISEARAIADKVQTLAELEEAVRNFDGCGIKKTASKTVFADGNPKAEVMIIGEAPGADEDRQGIPFCGANGQLLDRMMAAIGLDRSTIYLSNAVFWRPPGNRHPSPEEVSICLPLLEKHIALIAPKLLILSGGTATRALLQKDASISRLRGKFYDYSNQYMQNPIKTLLMYHPSHLLSQPLHKPLAWNDLQMAKKFINDKY